MPDLEGLFGGGKLSYEELCVKAGQLGMEPGDVTALRSDYEARIRELRCSHAVERELDRSGVKNREIAARLLDPEGITVDEDGVHGVTEQLDALRQNAPYLFEEPNSASTARTTPKTRTSLGMPHGAAVSDADSLSDAEFYRRVKKL